MTSCSRFCDSLPHVLVLKAKSRFCRLLYIFVGCCCRFDLMLDDFTTTDDCPLLVTSAIGSSCFRLSGFHVPPPRSPWLVLLHGNDVPVSWGVIFPDRAV